MMNIYDESDSVKTFRFHGTTVFLWALADYRLESDPYSESAKLN